MTCTAQHSMSGRRFVVRQVVVIFLVISLDPLKLEDRNVGISLEGFIVARNISTPNLVLPEVRTRSKTAAITSMSARKKLLMVNLLNSTLLANLLLLCNDVFLNPGPVDANADSSFSSSASDESFTLSF